MKVSQDDINLSMLVFMDQHGSAKILKGISWAIGEIIRRGESIPNPPVQLKWVHIGKHIDDALDILDSMEDN